MDLICHIMTLDEETNRALSDRVVKTTSYAYKIGVASMLIATSYFREGTMPEHEAENQTIAQNNNKIQRFEREVADRVKIYSTTDNVEPLYRKGTTAVQESYLHDKIDSL